MAEQVHEERIPILVLRDDPQGGFQEDTITTVVTRTWVRVRLGHELEPGAGVVIFNKRNGYQTEFLMESKPAPDEVKLLLRDHSVDIWQLDLGLASQPAVDERRRLHLVCRDCQTRESVPLEEYEFEKLERTGRLTRHCPQCAADTEWEEESAAQARAEEAAREKREKAELQQHARADRAARLQEQAEAAHRAEQEAQAIAEQIRQAAEEAAAGEAAEATRHAEAQAAQNQAMETARRLDAELAELGKARAAAEQKAQEAEAQIPEAASQAEAAAQALIKATKEAGGAEATAQKQQREAEEAASRAEQARRRAQDLAEKREQAREKAEAARQAIEQAQGAQEAVHREIMQILRKTEVAAEAKAAALKHFKEAANAVAKRATELSKAAEAAAAARAKLEETTTRLDAAAAARLLVNKELGELLKPRREAAAQPAAVAGGVPATAVKAAVDWSEHRSSRRIHVKTLARIRRAAASEVVEPVNVSRGGICFESRASYELDEVIWVAMHFRAGADTLETSSRIVRVSPRGNSDRFSYGVKFDA